MDDHTYQRHQNCEYFYQNAWVMGEGKYICLKDKKEEVLILQEIPTGCVKGFTPFHFPGPPPAFNEKRRKISRSMIKGNVLDFVARKKE